MQKVEEICRLLPCLSNEINWERGASKRSKDDVSYKFKNHSSLDILAAKQSSRGQRRTGGLMEECILIDGNILNEVVIPTTVIDRILANGKKEENEVVNQSQIYITTAGWKNSFSYDKLIELLVRSILEPDEVMIMGGTYKTPVIEGAQKKTFLEDLKMSDNFNEDSFDREYNSIWSGDAENAFFSKEKFDRHRVLNLPEEKFQMVKSGKMGYYIIGVDVGRKGCTSEAVVIKVNPQSQGSSIKSIVNLFSWDAEHFEEQAINIKRLFYKYKARKVVIDANGLGIGLIDFMVKSQIDPETNDILPDFGVENDEENFYKKFKTDVTELEAMYLIKANLTINTEAHSYVQSQLMGGRIKFLIDEQTAKENLMSTKMGQNMSPIQRNERLKPYVDTRILEEQMLNLVEENEGPNIILKQASRKIKKDKFSALEYGMYYIKKDEERTKKKKTRDISKMMFFT